MCLYGCGPQNRRMDCLTLLSNTGIRLKTAFLRAQRAGKEKLHTLTNGRIWSLCGVFPGMLEMYYAELRSLQGVPCTQIIQAGTDLHTGKIRIAFCRLLWYSGGAASAAGRCTTAGGWPHFREEVRPCVLHSHSTLVAKPSR